MSTAQYIKLVTDQIPYIMNFALAMFCMHYLVKLRAMAIAEDKRFEDKEDKRSFLSKRIWELIIAAIAIPDIPVLVELFL